MADSKVVVCPYCGAAQTAGQRCGACHGDFGPLSRRATQNQMGPWVVRDEAAPFRPGMSYEMIVQLIDNGTITRYTIIRGPSTGQLWTVARKTPGVAHLLGDCHHCNAKVSESVTRCPECHTVFGAWLDRNTMGLPEIRPLPGELGSTETTPFDPSSQPGFRPLSSDGLSAFLHTESSDPAEAPVVFDDEEDEDEDHVVHEDEGVSSIFDNSLRAELLRAKRQSSRLLIVASLAVLAAVASLAMVWLGGEDNSIIEEPSIVPATTEEAVLDPVEPVQEDVVAPTAPVPAVVVEEPVSQTTEEDLVAHLARAADGSLTIEKRSEHLDRAEELIGELTKGSPDTGTSTRLEEYSETLARLRERLVFDSGSE